MGPQPLLAFAVTFALLEAISCHRGRAIEAVWAGLRAQTTLFSLQGCLSWPAYLISRSLGSVERDKGMVLGVLRVREVLTKET